MKVRASRGDDRAGDRFVSWKTPGDPSPGSFTYGVDPATSLQLFTWNGSSPLWRSGAWTGYRDATEYVANISAVVYFTVMDVLEDDGGAYISFTVSPGGPRTRYVMSYSGELVLQRTSMEWGYIDVWPPYDCSRYGHCGPFSYCDNTAAAPACRCLDGFEPASGEEWSNGRFSQGCRRKEALRCGDGDDFLALPAMKAPDRFVVVGNRSLDECAAECRRNCSCVAYAYANLSSSAKGDFTRCLVWVGELIDTEKMSSNVAGSEILYLRLAGMDNKGVDLWKERKANDLVDLSIVESYISDEVLLCIHVGLLCVQDNPNDRPLMSSVVFILENGSTKLPDPINLYILAIELTKSNREEATVKTQRTM